MAFPPVVRIVEVGARDGLQNEPAQVPTNSKVQLIQALADAGLRYIEAGSFVSARSVPAMADSGDVFHKIRRKPGVRYSALVPNLKGLQAAVESAADEVAVFASASELFSEKNIRCTISESLERYRQVCSSAPVPVRGYVSCVVACPYEGPIMPAAVLAVAHELLAMGCYEISLGDTIGAGTPGQVSNLLSHLMKDIPADRLAVHFHDTYGQGLANILTALEMGIAVVDASVAGLGGCPYAPGATGNVATEDVLYMLGGMNIQTGVDLEKVAVAGWEICGMLNRRPASRVSIALQAKR